ncbi:hypothetical protein ACFLST_00050 [Chloroflexota bacterium]
MRVRKRFWVPLVLIAFVIGMVFLVAIILEDDTLGRSSWFHVERRPAPVAQVEEITRDYYATHQYIKGVYDCDDMAKDIWNILYARGIEAKLVMGNLDMDNERLRDSNHMWLLVWSEEGGGWFAVEATNGQVYCNIQESPYGDQYWHGFSYDDPLEARRAWENL